MKKILALLLASLLRSGLVAVTSNEILVCHNVFVK